AGSPGPQRDGAGWRSWVCPLLDVRGPGDRIPGAPAGLLAEDLDTAVQGQEHVRVFADHLAIRLCVQDGEVRVRTLADPVVVEPEVAGRIRRDEVQCRVDVLGGEHVGHVETRIQVADRVARTQGVPGILHRVLAEGDGQPAVDEIAHGSDTARGGWSEPAPLQ